jgi:hypothetical protein
MRSCRRRPTTLPNSSIMITRAPSVRGRRSFSKRRALPAARPGQLDSAGLHEKDGVGRIALGEDHLAAGATRDSSIFASLREKSYWIDL